ncbi:diaminopimelate decarboxylase [Acidihalobacter yilgarnensis]|uniref:Diaminopimelate decarboxylase n=1 Tax=Acidihalobacter yilgarnensis TaxID=2819280 RepID=A0A1D8IJN0_9GAMM|nr:diaminopimelate decarboxylase [Acidihalobacter yilgarnensis]AOU96643.1 diaminopimelate decarboxylase [Acidihalobacter yilgarnensis]
MDHFVYREDALCAEAASLEDIAARFGTPCYVYSRATLERHWRAFDDALGEHPHLICYAVKANANLAVLNLLARLGSGFDIVSVGELERVMRAGGDPARVVFSGIGKQAHEMRRALEVGIRCFNVESEPELERLNAVAGEMGLRAPVSLRVNPDVDPGTHPYIATGLKESKFGIDIGDARAVYRRAAALPHLDVVGVDCHIGSQLTRLAPFQDALDRVLALVDALQEEGLSIHHLDLGGGLGIRYRDETPPSPAEYAAALKARLSGRSLEILLEPGRAIVGNAGVLLTRVEYVKSTAHKHFAIVDAAMNDLLRPALYQGWHEIVPVRAGGSGEARLYDVVGPVCETGDFLGKERTLSIVPGDLLAVRSAGAYGFSMSSNYNARPRPPEVMVDGEQVYEVRARESIEHLMAGETCLPGGI